MTTAVDLACDPDHVNAELRSQVDRALEWLFAVAGSGGSARRLEQDVWRSVRVLGSTLLTAALAVRCRRSLRDALERQGLSEADVTLRTGKDDWASLTTTLGSVVFPLFSPIGRRRRRGGRRRGRRRARRSRARPSCWWSGRRGWAVCLMPFRHAQNALTFFTHGAVTVEDTTLARHTVAAGSTVTSEWPYRKRDEIREILAQRATRDAKTGRPLVYASTDAHALRGYSDETWCAT